MRGVCNHQIQPKIFFILIILLAYWANSAQAFKWKAEIVDSAGDTGWYSSLALNGTGTPSIAYINNDTKFLKYAVWNGSAWGFMDIDTSGHASQPSLFFPQEFLSSPQVTYFDNTSPGFLKYSYRRLLPLPMIWVTPETVDTGGVGWGSSLVVDQNGIPKVSYCDFTNSKLKYALRGNDGLWLKQTLDNACSLLEGVGETSLALDASGNPHITYWSVRTLKYAYYDGSWHYQELNSSNGGDVGRGNSLTRDQDGWFHVSYVFCTDTPLTNCTLKYAHRNLTNWVIFNPPIDTVQPNGQTSIAVDDHGGVHICYRKDGDLKYAHNGSKGFSTWVTQTLDGGDLLVGEFCSLKLDPNGKPRISYFDRTNGDLKFIQALYEIYQPLILKGN
jgi:hypothetical protein